MPTELRKSGIRVVGDLPWGTHFCHFYETKQDLLDILLPYFRAGLENNEFCVWVAYDPLNVEEATTALRRAVPQADRYFAAGAIEILPHNKWYLPEGDFQMQEVLDHWLGKTEEALAKGYDGLRANGNETWLTPKDWDDFREYERVLNELMTDQRMIVVCTYPLAKSRGGEIFDVTQTHQFAIAKRHGRWEIVESPALHQAKAELKRLNEELEQRIAERTKELVTTNEAMRQEVDERKQVEERLLQEKYLTEQIINSLPGVFYVLNEQGRFLRWNKNFERVTGYPSEEFAKLSPLALFVGLDQEKIQHCLENVFDEGRSAAEVELLAKDGTRTPYYFTGRRVSFGDKNYDFGMGLDITDRKRAEEQLRTTSEQLRALMESLRTAREEEGIRIARELHDDLGSALTGLKMDLSWLSRRLPPAVDEAVWQKLAAMSDFIDKTMQEVRHIATELRPSVLDDLGLVAAIKWQAKEFQQRTEIKCRVTARPAEITLSPEQSTAIFRILQEILTNVARHAQATSVQISFREQEENLILKVADNGRGIKESDLIAPQSLGLLGMRERAAVFGGRVDIQGGAGKGTTVTVSIPRK